VSLLSPSTCEATHGCTFQAATASGVVDATVTTAVATCAPLTGGVVVCAHGTAGVRDTKALCEATRGCHWNSASAAASACEGTATCDFTAASCAGATLKTNEFQCLKEGKTWQPAATPTSTTCTAEASDATKGCALTAAVTSPTNASCGTITVKADCTKVNGCSWPEGVCSGAQTCPSAHQAGCATGCVFTAKVDAAAATCTGDDTTACAGLSSSDACAVVGCSWSPTVAATCSGTPTCVHDGTPTEESCDTRICTFAKAVGASDGWQSANLDAALRFDGDAEAESTGFNQGWDTAKCFKPAAQSCAAGAAAFTCPTGETASANVNCGSDPCTAADNTTCCFGTDTTIVLTFPSLPIEVASAKKDTFCAEATGLSAGISATVKKALQSESTAVTLECSVARRRLSNRKLQDAEESTVTTAAAPAAEESTVATAAAPAAAGAAATETINVLFTATITGVSATVSAGLAADPASLQAAISGGIAAEMTKNAEALGVSADAIAAFAAAVSAAEISVAFKNADGSAADLTSLQAGAAAEAAVLTEAKKAADEEKAAEDAQAKKEKEEADAAADKDASSGAFTQNVALTVLFAIFSRFLF
jgi:hypothetical protein